jgi:hypothetical protein
MSYAMDFDDLLDISVFNFIIILEDILLEQKLSFLEMVLILDQVKENLPWMLEIYPLNSSEVRY